MDGREREGKSLFGSLHVRKMNFFRESELQQDQMTRVRKRRRKIEKQRERERGRRRIENEKEGRKERKVRFLETIHQPRLQLLI